MQRNKDVGKRILGLLLTICLVTGMIPAMPARAAAPDNVKITLYTDSTRSTVVDPESTYTYDGTAKQPYVVVEQDGVELSQNGNYLVNYLGNINAGTAVIKITGNGWEEDKEFKINPMQINFVATTCQDTEGASNIPYCYYTGSSVRPVITGVTGMLSNGQTVTLGSADYTITSINDTNACTDTNSQVAPRYTVNLTGNYAYAPDVSPATVRYRIYYNMNDVTVDDISGVVYNGAEQRPTDKVKLTNTRFTSDNVTADAQWANNVNAGEATLALTGTGLYKGQITKKFTIERANIADATVEFDQNPPVYDYTGSEILMADHVKVYFGTNLVPASNYTIQKLSGTDPGPATIQLVGINNLTGTKSATYQIAYRVSDCTYETELEYTAAKNVPSLTVKDGRGQTINPSMYTVTYYNAPATEGGPLYQNSDKIAEPTAMGLYYIRIEGDGSKNCLGTLGTEDAPLSFRIVGANLDKLKYKILGIDYIGSITRPYDGKSHYSAMTDVTVINGESALVKGTDFDVEVYGDEGCTTEPLTAKDCVNAGTYYIKVTGKEGSAYEGSSKILVYNIRAISATVNSIVVQPQIYIGGAVIPSKDDIEVEITANGSVITVDPEDYDFTCSNNTAVGTANITVTLKRNYTGQGTGTFIIRGKKINECSITTTPAADASGVINFVYNGSPQKPTVTVMSEDRRLTEGKEYEVHYYNSSNFIPANEITGRTDAGECYVVVKGKGAFANEDGDWSQKFKVSPKPLTSLPEGSFTAANRDYSETQVTPEVTVMDGSTMLVKDKDYTLVGLFLNEDCTTSVPNGTSGRVYVRIQGKGNYDSNSYLVTQFYIGNDISTLVSSIDVPGNLTYDGASKYSTINTALKVYRANGEELDRTRYDIKYYADRAHTRPITDASSEFTNAGTIYIGIEGKNGYYGSFDGSCVITPRSIATLEGSVTGTYAYTGSAVEPVIASGSGDGITLVDPNFATGRYTLTENDYRVVEYIDNTSAGTARIILAGKGNYGGNKTVSFTIQKSDLNNLPLLDVKVGEATYTSRKQLPSVTVTYGDNSMALVPEKDIVLEYYTDANYQFAAQDKDLTNAGETYVKISGQGNYTGVLLTATLKEKNKFTIKPRDISETIVSLEGQTYVYSDVLTASKIPDFTVRYQYAQGSYYTLQMGYDYTINPTRKDYTIGETQLEIEANAANLSGNFTASKTVTYYYCGNMDNKANEVTILGVDDEVEYVDTIGQMGQTFPSIVVRDSKGQTIDSSCYTVTYSNNKNVGLATISIQGRAERFWTGTYVHTFKIKGNISEAEVVIPDQVYLGREYTAEDIQNMQVTCHGYTLQKDRDYTISITNGTNASLKSAGTAAPTVTLTGTGDFFSGKTDTKKETFSIKYDINSVDLKIAKIPEQIYTGSPLEPEVTVTYEKPDHTIATLENGKDFEVQYFNNINVSAENGVRGPYAVITARDDGLLMGGSRTASFAIGKVDLASEEHGYEIKDLAEEYYYTGAAIRPTVTVQDKTGAVLDPSNYSIICESASWEAGNTVTLRVVGKNNYYNEISAKFKIVKRSLSNAANQVEAVIDDLTYNGMEQRPSFKVTFEDYNLDANGKGRTQTLVEGRDYQILGYYNNKDAGEGSDYNYESGPYVKIAALSGKSIEGERYIPFTIKPKEMDALYYSRVENVTYETGKNEYKPPVTVKISAGSEAPLEADYDYTIKYYNNTGAAAANNTVGPYIEISAYSHNFNGTHIIPFSILEKDITGEEFTVTLRETSGDIKFDDKKWNYPDPPAAGGAYVPKVILTDNSDPENPIDLTENDYQVDYANNNAVGTATITIKARSNYTGTRIVRFTIGTLFDFTNVSINQGNSPVNDSFEPTTYNGRMQKPADILVKRIVDPVAELTEGVEYEIRYYSDEACERPVPDVSVVNAGTYYVKISGLPSGGYIGDIVIPYTIKQKSVNSADVIVDEIPDQYYGGGNVRPAVRLSDKTTGLEIPNSAYDVTYRDNMSIGTATATITANENGNYTGTREVTFSILRQDIKGATVVKIPDYDYTGKPIIPEPVVYFNGTKLVKGKDYVLRDDPNYGNNIKAGKAWVVIQGIGNYTGVKADDDTSFNIKANLETATVSAVGNQVYTGKQVKPSVRVICGGNVLTAGVEYQITYGSNINPGDAYLYLTPTAKYSGLYTGSYVVRFSICDTLEKAEIGGIPTSQTYTKSPITPNPVVTIGTTVLKKNKDYTVRWSSNVNVGRAVVEIIGKGSYAGSKSKTYNIIAKNINRCKTNSIAAVSYNKKSQRPSVVVRDGSKVLAQNVDYTISYRSNKKIGTGIITLKGIGNYSGTKKVKFSIVSAPITGLKSTSMSTTSTKISWSKKSNITGYEVYTNNARKRIARTKKTSVTLNNLKQGTTYRYKVRTYTVIGKKTYYGAFKTIAFATKPEAPAITVSSTAKRQAKISWNRVSGANGYEVYAATSRNGSYKRIALILKRATVSYTNKRLTSGKTYYYKVRAYRTVNGKKVYSSYSTVKSVVVK